MFVHFAIGTIGSLLIFLLFSRISGEQSFSFPSVVILIGFFCSTMAHFLSPFATPVILILYAITSFNELRQYRAALNAMRQKNEQGQRDQQPISTDNNNYTGRIGK
ncbi:MAG: hypothetical protein HQK71_10935 [Desulfamplus sp.]|nr:hypothetical protein [Desulfamplus sp.]